MPPARWRASLLREPRWVLTPQPAHSLTELTLAPERGVDALLGAHTNFAPIDSKAAAAAEKLAFLCCDGPDANYASEDNRFLFGMHTRSSLYTVDFIRHMLSLTPAPRSVFVATKGPGIVLTEETC